MIIEMDFRELNQMGHIFWLVLFLLGLSPSAGAADDPLYADEVRLHEIGSPKNHDTCLTIPLPGALLPHRHVGGSGVRAYEVLINTRKTNGVPDVVLARHPELETWVLSSIPKEHEVFLRAVGEGRLPHLRHVGGLSVSQDISSMIKLLTELQAHVAEARRAIQKTRGRMIRYANNSRGMPENLKRPADTPFEDRTAQFDWLASQRVKAFDEMVITLRNQEDQFAVSDAFYKKCLAYAREHRIQELFQAFDPAYHVPDSADTVLIWLHGMTTNISNVLTLKTAVIQSMNMLHNTPQQGKVWSVGLSLPRHGGPELQTLDEVMAWFDQVVEFYRAKGKKVILSGRSASGNLVLEYAARFPEKLAAAIPYSHVWSGDNFQMVGNRDYLEHGPDEHLREIVNRELLDWTEQLILQGTWHTRMLDPEVSRRLPPIFMAHGWMDDEYKARQADGSWVSIMPRIVDTFATWAKNIPAIRYLVFEEGWHNLFQVHYAHRGRSRSYQALRLFLEDPQNFDPRNMAREDLGETPQTFNPHHIIAP